MYEAEITLMNEQGLHARPASIVAKKASKFTSHITLIKDGKEYNAKSIINILSMAASKGDTIKIVATGDDEAKAVEDLKIVIEKEIVELKKLSAVACKVEISAVSTAKSPTLPQDSSFDGNREPKIDPNKNEPQKNPEESASVLK